MCWKLCWDRDTIHPITRHCAIQTVWSSSFKVKNWCNYALSLEDLIAINNVLDNGPQHKPNAFDNTRKVTYSFYIKLGDLNYLSMFDELSHPRHGSHTLLMSPTNCCFQFIWVRNWTKVLEMRVIIYLCHLTGPYHWGLYASSELLVRWLMLDCAGLHPTIFCNFTNWIICHWHPLYCMIGQLCRSLSLWRLEPSATQWMCSRKGRLKSKPF